MSCVRSLKDSAFAQKTITKGRVEHPALKSQDEIISNVLWRFLQIRGYINEKHELTNYGLVLEAVLSSLEANDSELELGVIAVELLKLGLLNTTSVPGVANTIQGMKSNPFHKTVADVNKIRKLHHTPF